MNKLRHTSCVSSTFGVISSVVYHWVALERMDGLETLSDLLERRLVDLNDFFWFKAGVVTFFAGDKSKLFAELVGLDLL